MNELLAKIIDAHGGMERWNGHEKVDATIVSGGGLFPLKGVPQDSNPRRMTVWLHEERSSVLPYGAPDQRTMFTSDRIAIEKLNGTLVTERYAPRDSFAGHQMSTLGSAASCLFQRRGSMDLPHHALSSRDGPRANIGDRIVARERRNVARVARILSGFD
jgi:hypothetical protein